MADYRGPWQEVAEHIGDKDWVAGSIPASKGVRKPHRWDGRRWVEESVTFHWGDAHNGTWFVAPQASDSAPSGISFWPCAEEAELFAQKLAEGFSEAGALQRMISDRNDRARKECQDRALHHKLFTIEGTGDMKVTPPANLQPGWYQISMQPKPEYIPPLEVSSHPIYRAGAEKTTEGWGRKTPRYTKRLTYDQTGEVWVLTSTNSLFRFRDGRWQCSNNVFYGQDRGWTPWDSEPTAGRDTSFFIEVQRDLEFPIPALDDEAMADG